MNGEEDESGATATAVFIGGDELLISHIGDSSAVCIIYPVVSQDDRKNFFIHVSLYMKEMY